MEKKNLGGLLEEKENSDSLYISKIKENRIDSVDKITKIVNNSLDLDDTKVFRVGSKPEALNYNVIPSGSLMLDYKLGVFGIPTGRIVHIYGKESSGKTTLALKILANAQRMNYFTAFIDMEHAISLNWAKMVGIDIEQLIISQPEFLEQAAEITEKLIDNDVKVIIIDSVAALVTKEELDNPYDKNSMALIARGMSKFLRKINPKMSEKKATIVFINQLRDNIGQMYGNPDITPGGRAIKFFSSISVGLRAGDKVDFSGDKTTSSEDIYGRELKFIISKNKVAPPLREGSFILNFDGKIDNELELIEIASHLNIVEQKGKWYQYKEQKFDGKKTFYKLIKENRTIFDEIYNEVKNVVASNNNNLVLE